MKITGKQAPLFILFCLLAASAFGQTAYTRQDVRDLFPINTKNVWINQLRGYLDGIHLVDMLIGTDGHSCKGVYTLVSSGETFFVEGQEKDHWMELVELNGDQRLSGFLFGKYDGRNFEGHWMNTEKSDSLSLVLHFVGNYAAEEPIRVSPRQWHRIYEGMLEGKKQKIYLKKEEDTFYCVLEDDGRRQLHRTKGKGGKAEFLVFGFSGCVLEGKWLGLDTTALQKVDVILPAKDGYEVVGTLKESSALEFTTYEYADYHSRLVCLRPLSENVKFTQWMDQKLQNWVDDHEKQLVLTGTSSKGSKDRWVQYAEGWVEVDLFLPQVVSGTIYLQSSLETHTEKIPFIFDLKNDRPVVIADLFLDKISARETLSRLVREQVEGKQWQQLESVWVTKQDFGYCTLSDAGICCRTDFHSVFGEKTITLTYDALQPFLKDNSILKAITGK